jgi:CDP-glucose 4,6-dehydratase
MFEDYKGKRILVTGCYGFKGSWLTLWLDKLGAEVWGYGHLPSSTPNHFSLLNTEKMHLYPGDLLNYELLRNVMLAAKPELVIHLAAKAIVAKTFEDPRGTFRNNIEGAVNILEACMSTPSVKGVVMITTDKVYQDKNWSWGYRENDSLGGYDPYSASKVCIEHVIESYRHSFGMNIAVARAGNVIGGGDWSYARIIPDIVRATIKGEPVIVHTPTATRPFQFVLEPLKGYLMLGERIMSGVDVNRPWNFGPTEDMSVLNLLHAAKAIWPEISWKIDETPTHKHMVYLLKLDSSDANNKLGWHTVYSMMEAVQRSIMWYKKYYTTGEVTSLNDIDTYQGECDLGRAYYGM